MNIILISIYKYWINREIMPKLPKEILIDRILNELMVCKRKFRHNFYIMNKSLNELPIEVDVEMLNTPAPVKRDGKVEINYNHRFKLFITEDYPYRKPNIRWESEIFHPNIMDPDEGGFVCTNILARWTFRSNLYKFIKGIESLLSNPNPDNPFETPSCEKASDYFKRYDFKPPEIVESKKSMPKIVEDEEAEEAEEKEKEDE
jgi:ubiquitin-protein ligase